MTQVAFFDTYPSSDSAAFNGAWSVFPYFDSGIVIVSDIESGLFVLQPRLALPACGVLSDVPWLSVTPATTNISPSSSMSFDVVFDATGLTPGLYEAHLCITSDDLLTPRVTFPVSFTVDPAPVGGPSPILYYDFEEGNGLVVTNLGHAWWYRRSAWYGWRRTMGSRSAAQCYPWRCTAF